MFDEIDHQIPHSPYDRLLKPLVRILPKRLKPNQITFFRLICSPFLIVLLLSGDYLTSIVVFVVLAFTDMLDGSMARIRHEITDWGKIWDPIADKVLIGSVVAVLLLQVNLSLTILLLAFEAAFILGGAFYKMHEKEIEIKANVWGKIKMNLHCLGAICLIVGHVIDFQLFLLLAQGFFYLSLLFAALSILIKGKKGKVGI